MFSFPMRSRMKTHLPTSAIRPSQKTTFILGFLPYVNMTTPKFLSLAGEETSFDEW